MALLEQGGRAAAEPLRADCRVVWDRQPFTPNLCMQEPRLDELPAIAKSVNNRDEAIKHGLTLQGTRYEVNLGKRVLGDTAAHT